MYAALWRHLPGPWPIKALLATGLLLVFVWAFFTWIFPWVAAHLPVNDPSVGTMGAATGSGAHPASAFDVP